MRQKLEYHTPDASLVNTKVISKVINTPVSHYSVVDIARIHWKQHRKNGNVKVAH